MNPYLFRRIRGPVFLLCFALTAVLNQWHILSFAQSWPLYLLVAGMVSLLEALLFPAMVKAALSRGLVPPRRRSLTRGVVVLILGFLFLLTTTGVISGFHFWSLYGTWWPLLLILVGVLLLVERLFERRIYVGQPGGYPAYTRPRHGGLPVLIVLLVLLGLVSHGHRMSGPWGMGNGWGNGWDQGWNHWDWDNWNFGNESYSNSVALEQAIPAGATLRIENARGDVQIAPSTDGRLHVEARQQANVPKARKDNAFAATRPQIDVHGSEVRLTVPGQRGVSVALEIQVPEAVHCSVRTEHGDVSVAGLKQGVEISQSHGDTALDNVAGGVHIAADHGDVTARNIAGDVAVEGQADDVTLASIGGNAVLHGEFYGDTQLDGVKGAVTFHSSRTDASVGHLEGSLSLSSDEMHLSGASGGVRIVTRSKSVEIEQLTGDATVIDSNGDIRVVSALPVGTVSLKDSTGDISLTLPTSASFNLSGSTGSDDTIESEWPFVQSTQGGSKTIRGQAGHGGPTITLQTEHGDLTIRKGADEHPEKSDKPVRHLKPPSDPGTPVAAPVNE